MTEVIKDYWQSGAEELTQPKRQVGDYVESEGFSVPNRFETLDEALSLVKAGGTVLMRSEHPDEYDGPSGLHDSIELSLEEIERGKRVADTFNNYPDIDREILESADRQAVTNFRLQGPGSLQVRSMIIGKALEVDPSVTESRLILLDRLQDESKNYSVLNRHATNGCDEDISYSYWEYKPGLSAVVVADDVIDGRYHLFIANQTSMKIAKYHGGSIVNLGGELLRQAFHEDGVLDPQLSRMLTVQYEAIRNLPRFSSTRCPIMEMQVDELGNPWFLQYHIAREFRASTDRLLPNDYPESEGWQQVEAVRGAIDSPSTVKMAYWYPRTYGMSRRTGFRLPEVDEASAGYEPSNALNEILSRRRGAYISSRSFHDLYTDMATGHGNRTRWFKPQTALACNDKNLSRLIDPAIKEEVSRAVHLQGEMARIVIDVASDGLSGYVRLNPDAEQPVYSVH